MPNPSDVLATVPLAPRTGAEAIGLGQGHTAANQPYAARAAHTVGGGRKKGVAPSFPLLA